jgi:DNA-binding transcriptional LysR family regulator
LSQFKRPSKFSPDPLTEVILAGAKELLRTAVQAEVSAFIAAHVHLLDEEGRQRLVRHGFAADYELSTILPELVSNLRSIKPNIGIHTYPIANRNALEALTIGQIDMAVGHFDFPPRNADMFVADELFTEEYVIAGCQDHPLLKSEASIEQLAGADHMQILPFGPVRDMIDHALMRHGYKRNVQTIVPSLFAALSILETSDLVVSLPGRVARKNAQRFNLIYRSLPMEVGTFNLHSVRHVRDKHSALHVWLVQRLKILVESNRAD